MVTYGKRSQTRDNFLLNNFFPLSNSLCGPFTRHPSFRLPRIPTMLVAEINSQLLYDRLYLSGIDWKYSIAYITRFT